MKTSGGLSQPPWLARRRASPVKTTEILCQGDAPHRQSEANGDDIRTGAKQERNGGLAQLGERLPCKQEVSGSIPLISTKRLIETPSEKLLEVSLSLLRDSNTHLEN